MKFCHSKEVAINQHQASCKFTNNCNLLHLSRRLAISFDLENARGARVKHRVLVFSYAAWCSSDVVMFTFIFSVASSDFAPCCGFVDEAVGRNSEERTKITIWRCGKHRRMTSYMNVTLTWNMMKPAMRSVQSPDWIFCPSSSRLRMAKFHKINRARAWLRRLIINKHTRSGKWISIIKIILSAVIHCASIMRSKHAIVAAGSWTNYIIAQLEKPLHNLFVQQIASEPKDSCRFARSLLSAPFSKRFSSRNSKVTCELKDTDFVNDCWGARWSNGIIRFFFYLEQDFELRDSIKHRIPKNKEKRRPRTSQLWQL